MALKFFEIRRAKKNSSTKRIQREQQARKTEYRLELELLEKLADLLEENDSVLIEVNPRIIGEFINILDSKVKTMYEYEQIDSNKFIFSNKEMDW